MAKDQFLATEWDSASRPKSMWHWVEGTQNITLRIKATCPAIGAGGGLKAIIPYIANVHSRVWNTRVNLPTIWVSRRSATGKAESRWMPTPCNHRKRWNNWISQRPQIFRSTKNRFKFCHRSPLESRTMLIQLVCQLVSIHNQLKCAYF